MGTQKLTDESEDKKYFFLTPQIVWAKSQDPYDFTLWNVIKMVAGELGECFLSTEQLATLAMMSTGKVSECRQRLIDRRLLKGELRRDPNYPQPVWHLQIPNLWKENLEWREGHESIKSRMTYKSEQKSLHQVKPSPGEEGIPPGEEGIPPGETKKNHKEKPKGKTNLGARAKKEVPAALSLTSTPSRRIFQAEYRRAISDPNERKPPGKFSTLVQAETFDKAAVRLNGHLKEAIDAALGAGICDIARLVRYIAAFNPGQKGASDNGQGQHNGTSGNRGKGKSERPDTLSDEQRAAFAGL